MNDTSILTKTKNGFILIEIIFFFLLMSLLFSILSTPLQSLTHSIQGLSTKKQALQNLKNDLEDYLSTGAFSISFPYTTSVVDGLSIYHIKINATQTIEVLAND